MYIHKCYLVELIVSSTFGFVVISSLSIIGSSVFMSLNVEISFSKCISLGIIGKMNLKNTYVSKILVHIPLSVVEKG